MRALVVLDLGFGDAGKGLVTDFLVRDTGSTLVVRYNGGAQAGHNVVTPDGRHHTFAQFGAGSFVPGVRTFLSRHVVVHPTALLLEGERLQANGVADPFARLRVSERARVITPLHQAANRLRELARGTSRHGSCGVGVGETVQDALSHPGETVLAGDLRDASTLRRKLRRVQERKRSEIEELRSSVAGAPEARPELEVLDGDEVQERWIAEASRVAALGLLAPDALLAQWMAGIDAVVFEGAQGVLLDETAGFHPFTTWSHCTAENALELIAEAAPHPEVRRIGVLRTHVVRHGPGPLPTETADLRPVVVDHNAWGVWQGPVRHGWFDAVLARYALAAAGGVDALALTHLDVPARLGAWRLCDSYTLPTGPLTDDFVAERSADGLVRRLGPPTGPDLDRQTRLTSLLARAVPSLEDCEPTPEAVCQRTERVLGHSIEFVAQGPRSSDVVRRRSLEA